MDFSIQKCRKTAWKLLPATAVLMATGVTLSAYGATIAGTEIRNLATVSYEDSAGNSFTAQSNEAIVTVAQVYSASINSTDTSVAASPGQPVDISYTLENTGNGPDTYDLSAIDGIVGGDDIDADSIVIFADLNNNGQADAGEPAITDLTLTAGEIASIVVRAEVPSDALAGEELGVTLTAQAQEGTGSAVAASVSDLTANQGPDGLDGTVESLITVTGDAVVVATKNSVHNSAAAQIDYTITIQNNGNADALNVVLQDAIPANTNFVAGSAVASGLITSNSDILPAFGVGVLDETADGIDYNNDGDTLDTLDGLTATDAVLPANATVTVSYTVSYDPALVSGGTRISNIAYITADVDGDGVADTLIPTNQANVRIGNIALVTITDTAENTGGDSINDGQDDDAANDVQLVDQASAGERVIFRNLVANNGNADDILELSISNTSFPAGTVFTFWNEAITVQLGDSNGAFGVDAGLIPVGSSETITVIAQLPASINGPGNYDAVVTVTSANDTGITDTVTVRLGNIVESTIDIHNASGGVLGTDENPIGTPDYSAVSTIAADVNTSVNIPLFIDNDGNAGNAFQLAAGGVFDSATSAVNNLPSGWNVEFFLSDSNGNPTGAPVTATPVIAGQSTDFEIIAVVSIPDQTLAVGNYSVDNDADGVVETVDGNNDGDGDYLLFFQVTSNSTGASDVTTAAVDVNPVIAASLSPNGSAQIAPGGTELYQNTLANNGNDAATYEIDSSNSQASWSSTLSVDTDGDGAADTELANITAGTIQVQQPNGSVVAVEVAISASGQPIFTLDAGELLPIDATVFAPANAVDSEVDVLTINATNVDTGDVVTAQNQTQVVSGQVNIIKTVAIDNNCDGAPDTAFVSNPGTVEPGQCLVWQIVAQNQGAANAFNVQVRDAAPAFTTYVPGSMSYCQSQNCVLVPVTDTVGDDEGEETAGDVVFYVGTGATPASGLGGELIAGEFATVQFSVQVD